MSETCDGRFCGTANDLRSTGRGRLKEYAPRCTDSATGPLPPHVSTGWHAERVHGQVRIHDFVHLHSHVALRAEMLEHSRHATR
jgi:hypothetical protein